MPPGFLRKIVWAIKRGNQYMARRFGFDTKQNLALAGAMLAAPVAAIASPIIGLGVVGAMTVPHLYGSAKRTRREQLAALQPPGPAPDGDPQGAQEPEQEGEFITVSRKDWQATQERLNLLTAFAQEQIDQEQKRERMLAELAGQTELLHLALSQMEHGPESLERAKKAMNEQALEVLKKAGVLDHLQQELDEQAEAETGQDADAERAAAEAAASADPDDEFAGVRSWLNPDAFTEEQQEILRKRLETARKHVAKTKANWGRIEKEQVLESLQPQGPYNREQYLEQRRRARDQEPPPAVMAIEPHWAEPLLDGTMKYEFRLDGSNALKDVRPGARVAIYGAKDEGAGELLGYYTVGERFDVTLENVHEHWPKLKGRIPHNFEDFVRYLQASKDGRVVVTGVANPQRMRRSVDLYERLGAPVQGGRVVKDKKVRDTILDAIDENDAAICEEAGGQYPWSEGTRPSVPFLYRALRSKLKRGDSLAMPGYDEEFFERLKRENPGLEGKWKAHLKRVKERHAQVRSKQKTARKAQGGQRKASGAAA